MTCLEIQQCISRVSGIDYATAIAAVAAIIAAASAVLSYRLSKIIFEQVKSDEMIVVGPLHHPGLPVKSHDDAVLRCTVFNKSARKTYITSVKAFDQNNHQIPITWSHSIDSVGNIENPTGLLGLVDGENLYLRRNDGQVFAATSLQISHSFGGGAIIAIFDPYQGPWQ